MTLHATVRTTYLALGNDYPRPEVHRVRCLDCPWLAWLLDRVDAERYAARHVAVTARGEGR